MYGVAMDKNGANTLIQEAQRRAVIVAGQIGFNKQAPNLSEFEPYNKTSAGEFKDVTTEGLYKQFGIQVSGVKKSVCENILRTIGESTPIRRLSLAGTPTPPITSCEDNNAFLFVYNNDMTGENDTQYCERDESCGVCGVCSSTTHLCESECTSPDNECDDDTDCNAENECMVCDTENHKCKDGCKRVQYLEILYEAKGNRIETGLTALETDKIIFDSEIIRTEATGDCYIAKATNTYFDVGSKQNTFYIRFGSSAGSVGASTIFGHHVYELYKEHFDIDGVTKATPTFNAISGDWVIGSTGTTQYIKHYSIKIIDMSTNKERMHLIPVLSPESSKGEGKACMFDKVTKELFCNAGTGDDFKTNLDD